MENKRIIYTLDVFEISLGGGAGQRYSLQHVNALA